jgi:hypothetical protein
MGPENLGVIIRDYIPLMSLSSAELDPIGSRMLDSIKATLTRVLGQESAQAIEFYVDEHLALNDPGAFETALADFLGSQAGRILIEAIKADMRSENEKHGMPEPELVSRFLSHQIESTSNRPPGSPTSRLAPKRASAHRERFVRTANLATATGISFRDLVTQGLVASEGETCGFATLACLGRKALDNPDAFAEKVATIFGLEGATLLNSLTAFCEIRAKGPQITVS